MTLFHAAQTYTFVSNFDKVWINCNDIWVIIQDMSWGTFPFTDSSRSNMWLVNYDQHLVKANSLSLICTGDQRTITIVNIECKLVVTQQEFVIHTIHGQRLQWFCMTRNKKELRILSIRNITTCMQILRINHFKPSFTDNIDLGLQEMNITSISSNIEILICKCQNKM